MQFPWVSWCRMKVAGAARKSLGWGFWEHKMRDLLILGNGMLQGTSNFFMSVRTLPGRPSMLSYRALSSFWGMKSFFSGARYKALKTRINSEYLSKGSIYILHLLAFALISIFQRTVLKLKIKNGIWESDEKMRNAGSRPKADPVIWNLETKPLQNIKRLSLVNTKFLTKKLANVRQ